MDFSSQLSNLKRKVTAVAAVTTKSSTSTEQKKNTPANNDNADSDNRSNNTRSDNAQGRISYSSSTSHRSVGNYNNNHHHHYQQQQQQQHYPGQNRTTYSASNSDSYHNRRKFDSEETHLFPKLIQAIPKYQPIPVLKKPKRRHIALLFITIDDLPFENIWKGWLESIHGTTTATAANANSKIHSQLGGHLMNSAANAATANANTNMKEEELLVSILVHAKYPERVQSAWLKQRLLVVPPSSSSSSYSKNRKGHGRNSYNPPSNHTLAESSASLPPIRYHSRRPEWGSIEITRAMIDLLEEALRIGTGRDNSDRISDGHGNIDSRYSTQRYLSSSADAIDLEQESDRKPLSQQQQQLQQQHRNKGGFHNRSSVLLPTVDRFLFVSETCFPVTTLQEVEMALFGSSHSLHSDVEKSWIHARNTPNNGFARQLQWDKIARCIPRENIWKADQWIVLTRHHAWPLCSLIEEAAATVTQQHSAASSSSSSFHPNMPGRTSNYHHHPSSSITSYHTSLGSICNSTSNNKVALWQCFRHANASDEMYIPTALSLLGILQASTPPHEDTTPQNETEKNISSVHIHAKEDVLSFGNEIANRRVTYCDWSMNAKNPETFLIDRKNSFKDLIRVVALARKEGCLFARKFVPSHLDMSTTTSANSQIDGNDANNISSKDIHIEEAITVDEWKTIVSQQQEVICA